MPDEFTDRIAAYTLFNSSGGKIQPVKFRWHGRVYRVDEVTYRWETREGMTRREHFSARSGGTLFELVFDTQELTWEVRNAQVLSG